MIFFLVMPGLFGGFGNYFIVIFQGSPEVVYPRVNNFSILILSLSSFFSLSLSFLWIGAQFPQEKFLSYGRILTLHYYFLLMCILFSEFIISELLTCPLLIRLREKEL